MKCDMLVRTREFRDGLGANVTEDIFTDPILTDGPLNRSGFMFPSLSEGSAVLEVTRQERRMLAVAAVVPGD